MKRKKILLAIGIIVMVIFAIGYCASTYGRLMLIRMTMYIDLPGWLQAWLWGWR